VALAWALRGPPSPLGMTSRSQLDRSSPSPRQPPGLTWSMTHRTGKSHWHCPSGMSTERRTVVSQAGDLPQDAVNSAM
jgi:hypothetical protein